MDTTDDTTPAAPARSCGNCGSGMERHQDWCLECGTAAPGRLGGLRPGWRAVSTTLALTLVLVGGAGAASYAALSSDANREAMASVPADATPVAQAPPIVPAIPAPVVPAPLPVAPPASTVTTPAAKLPVAPKVATVPTPSAPQVTTPAVTETPARSKSSTRSNSTAAGERGEGTNADGDDTAATTALEPIALGADALSVYDPYDRSDSPGDPAEAYDGDSQTTFEVGAPDDGKEIQVGVVVDLESAKQVRAIEFTTTTPGGRVEVYATDSSALPPDILDTRWDHPASRSDVDGSSRGGDKAGDGVERIVLPKGGAKYRYVVLWFTEPPEGTTRVGLTELKLLG